MKTLFEKDGVEIILLETIEEYKEEGTALGHCLGHVTKPDYYKLRNEIVVSIRENGERKGTASLNGKNITLGISKSNRPLDDKHKDILKSFVLMDVDSAIDEAFDAIEEDLKEVPITDPIFRWGGHVVGVTLDPERISITAKSLSAMKFTNELGEEYEIVETTDPEMLKAVDEILKSEKFNEVLLARYFPEPVAG